MTLKSFLIPICVLLVPLLILIAAFSSPRNKRAEPAPVIQTASHPPRSNAKTVDDLVASSLSALEALRVQAEIVDKAVAEEKRVHDEYGPIYKACAKQDDACKRAYHDLQAKLQVASLSTGDVEAAFAPVYAAKALYETEQAKLAVEDEKVKAGAARWDEARKKSTEAQVVLSDRQEVLQDAVYRLLHASEDGKAALSVVQQFAKIRPHTEKFVAAVRSFEEWQKKLEHAVAEKKAADLAYEQDLSGVAERRWKLSDRQDKLIETPYSKARESEFEAVRKEARELKQFDDAIGQSYEDQGTANAAVKEARDELRRVFVQILIASQV